MNALAERSVAFIHSLAGGPAGEFRICPGGQNSLYASCYALMALNAVGALDSLSEGQKRSWAGFLNDWQEPESGYFLGPELAPEELARVHRFKDQDYIRLHLAIHVLPALDLLGARPRFRLRFAERFAEPAGLLSWLEQRDWRKAWLEGNNLIACGQLLVHLHQVEGDPAAARALTLYFDWLDEQQDPATGLWGTNGHSPPAEALYGAYHQLLLYHYCRRPVRHADRITDTVLALQQPDGSFTQTPGGGACEDLDAVDVLVNLVKRTGYRRTEVAAALVRTAAHVLRQEAPDGGFVYRWGQSFLQNGALRTFVPAGVADSFSTWFRLHALALISEVVAIPDLDDVPWRFNRACSMGWHDPAVKIEKTAWPSISTSEIPKAERVRSWRPGYSRLLRTVPKELGARLLRAAMVRYMRALGPADGLETGLALHAAVDRAGRELAYEAAGGLEIESWFSQRHLPLLPALAPGVTAWHLGCGDGSLSYTLAALSGARILAFDRDPARIARARHRYRAATLCFLDANEVPDAETPEIVVMTDVDAGGPCWEVWAQAFGRAEGATLVVQHAKIPARWQDVRLASGGAPGGAAALRGPLANRDVSDAEYALGVWFVTYGPLRPGTAGG
jgi:hypothetical protein